MAIVISIWSGIKTTIWAAIWATVTVAHLVGRLKTVGCPKIGWVAVADNHVRIREDGSTVPRIRYKVYRFTRSMTREISVVTVTPIGITVEPNYSDDYAEPTEIRWNGVSPNVDPHCYDSVSLWHEYAVAATVLAAGILAGKKAMVDE